MNNLEIFELKATACSESNNFESNQPESNNPELIVDPETQLVTVDDPNPTISVLWDRAVQQAVIESSPGPTIAARAYAILHTAIYDAWSAYEDTPISTQLGDELQRPDSENTAENKTEAISYAAFHVLSDLFSDQQEIFVQLMQDLGFDPNLITNDTTTPAGIGFTAADALLNVRQQDGSNQLGDDPNGDGTPYSDTTGFENVNTPGNVQVIDQFTLENVPINNSDPTDSDVTQQFLTPQFGDVTPFGLESGDQFRPEAPEPFLLVDGEVDLEAKTITLADCTELEISRDLIGTVINPDFIAQAEEIVDISANLTDEQKIIAEFWEDGGGTSFPPGTNQTFGQYVSARDNNTLDEDVELFFALGNAELDAGIAAWDSKVFYNYPRPVRTIRELGELGLIGEFNEDLGGYAIEAYAGPGQGTQTILASEFITYQNPGSDSSPPFAEYVSGHSTFSAAGAEVLKQFTGSDYFGASVTFEPGSSRFESGIGSPSEDITLEWSTFSEAADESGISRLYGGIHWDQGDQEGRDLGRQVGAAAFEQAQFFINGGDPNATKDPVIGTDPANVLAGVSENDDLSLLSLSSADANGHLDVHQGGNYLDGGTEIVLLYGYQGYEITYGDSGYNQFDSQLEDILIDNALGTNDIYHQADSLTFGEPH